MAWVCANEQGFGSPTKRKSSISNNSRPWHYFRCSAQSPRTQCGTGWQLSFKGSHKLVSSVRTPTHLHCSSHRGLHPYGFFPEAVMWERGSWGKGSTGPRGQRRPQAQQDTVASSLGTLTARPALHHRCSALAQQLNHHISLGIKLGPEVCFCFSKVKCIGVTLIPGLSPTLHDITVSIWPVKTLALCPERFTDLRQSEEEFCSPWALLSKTAEF